MVKCKKCNATGYIITMYKSGVEDQDYCDCEAGITAELEDEDSDSIDPFETVQYWIEKANKYKKALEKISNYEEKGLLFELDYIKTCDHFGCATCKFHGYCWSNEIAKEALKED